MVDGRGLRCCYAIYKIMTDVLNLILHESDAENYKIKDAARRAVRVPVHRGARDGRRRRAENLNLILHESVQNI